MQIALIGAGLAGLACATRLTAAGHTVRLFDKGRGPGGRMASRRIATPAGEAAFDHGAQYFTARDPAFAAQVQTWSQAGLAAPWAAAGPGAWVGTPAMNAPIKQLAARLDVQWNATVKALVREGTRWRIEGEGIDAPPVDAALIAIPAEQAGPLLATVKPDWSARAAATPAQPCWAVLAAFTARVSTEADVMKEQGPIAWAARNSAKPGRNGPEAWVIQAGPDWSRTHLEETPETIVPQLMRAFTDLIGAALPPTLTASAHRWRYAKAGKEGSGALWDPVQRLGIGGDWLLGPRVECAWVSGTRLASLLTSSEP